MGVSHFMQLLSFNVRLKPLKSSVDCSHSYHTATSSGQKQRPKAREQIRDKVNPAAMPPTGTNTPPR